MAKAKASGNLEFGQLPVLEVDGKFLAQSIAILRYIGLRYGYYPAENPELAWRVDSTIDSLGDILNAFYKAAFGDEALKPELFKTFFGTTVPTWLAIINKRLQSNSSKQFIVGDNISIADFALAAWVYGIYYNELSQAKDSIGPIIEQFPDLVAYFKGLGEIFADYLASRPKCPW
jgi:glutathione S-transferase